MADKPTSADTGALFDSRVVAPGSKPAPSAAPSAGESFGRYRLLDFVGAGGFSIVWRAEQVDTGEVVALKLPRVPEFIRHLQREALIASRLQDRQVVGITEVCLDHDPPFLVMPFVPGSNLELPDKPPAPQEIEQALRRFRQIVEVVARLHDAEVVHGDLKPANIRFSPEGVCHVLDLGLARHQVSVRQNSTLRASVVSVTGEKIAGTLEFMAPEVMSGARPEKAADVYALGVILHTMLCGRPPAFGISSAELNPYLPPGMTDFLRQALHISPRSRPASAGALLPALDSFIHAEQRCLRRRNGHARRLVFQRRMATLARGIKVVAWIALVGLMLMTGWSWLGEIEWRSSLGVAAVYTIIVALFVGCIGFLLAVTTLNAWILGIPEKTYKQRSGHPWWTFMMQ
jgi:hypothetical protein